MNLWWDVVILYIDTIKFNIYNYLTILNKNNFKNGMKLDLIFQNFIFHKSI